MGFEERLRRAERGARSAESGSGDGRDRSGRLEELGLSRPHSIIDFYFDYLGQPVLYPKQGLILKSTFLELENLTDYDHRTLEQWGTGFTPGVGDDGNPSFVGSYGVPPTFWTGCVGVATPGTRGSPRSSW
jgi:hypothetical protein